MQDAIFSGISLKDRKWMIMLTSQIFLKLYSLYLNVPQGVNGDF